MIGNFRIIEALVGRPSADVFLAEHTGLERRVHLRVLRRELVADEDAIGRFVAEAKVGSRLKGTNVPEILDIGQLPDGRRYYAMEEVRGPSLAEVLEAGPVPLPRARGILRGIAEALHRAHEGGIIHRDLRPANVRLVERAEGTEHVLVMGFGEPPSPGEDQGFRSPEQGCGVDAQIDPRTDVYALGAIAYRMLSGRPPFEGATAGELLLAQMTRCPAPFTDGDATLAGVEGAVQRALSRDPGQRFRTARAFVAALDEGPAVLPAATPATIVAAIRTTEEPWFDAALDDEVEAPAPRGWQRSPLGIGAIVLGLVGVAVVVVLLVGKKNGVVAVEPRPPAALPVTAATAPPAPSPPVPVAKDPTLAPEPTAKAVVAVPAPREGTKHAAPEGWHPIDFTQKHAASTKALATTKPGSPGKPAAPGEARPAQPKKPAPENNPDAKRMLAYPE